MGADTQRGPVGVRSLRADDDGLFFELVDPQEDVVVDVLFDGRRIWSFWTLRDSEPAGAGRHVPWPFALTRFLEGRTSLSLVEHVSAEPLATTEAVLGAGEGPI